MTLPPRAQAHEWKITTPILGTSTGFSPVVTAVCRKCGEIRTAQWPGIGRGASKIDLTGNCPG